MGNRTLNWGQSASAARYQTQDDDAEGGDFVFVRDLDNATVPLQYLFTTEELLAGVGIDLDENDLANVGDVAATTASVSEAPSEATDVARNEDLSEIQESADVEHDETVGGTSGNPHEDSASISQVDAKADDPHGNEAHSETFAVDGDAQPPENHDNEAHTTNFTDTSPSDVTSSNWGDFEIQKNGTDGNGIINFKTE